MVNFNEYLFTIKYFFCQCFEIIAQRTKPKDDEDEDENENIDDNKKYYKSISDYDIKQDDINNFVIIDSMVR